MASSYLHRLKSTRSEVHGKDLGRIFIDFFQLGAMGQRGMSVVLGADIPRLLEASRVSVFALANEPVDGRFDYVQYI